MFEHNLRRLFAQLESLPHADTRFRLLCRIDVGQSERAPIALVNHLIRNKKLTRYLINNCYPIGIDGTQKIAFSALWDERRQLFEGVNTIRYEYGPNAKKAIDIPVVVCREQWEEVDPDTLEIVTQESQHAWISSRPLRRLNVHTRCHLGALYRWGIEGAFRVEKHQGYAYEHAFAKQWNAGKGCHHPMRPAHLLTLARFSKELAELFSELRAQAAIGFIRNTLTGPWLDRQPLEQRMALPFL